MVHTRYYSNNYLAKVLSQCAMYHQQVNMDLLEYCNRNEINIVLPNVHIKVDHKNELLRYSIKEENKKWPIDELISFFSTYKVEKNTFRLDKCTLIIDIEKFLDSHISISRHHNGELAYKCYYDRLVMLKKALKIPTKRTHS